MERLSKLITTGNIETLPDKGAKLRSIHRQCREEIDRRDLARIQKDIPECQRAVEGHESPDQSGGDVLNIMLTGSSSQGISEIKTDAAFSEELRFMNPNKCKGIKENGLQLQQTRQPLPSASNPKKDGKKSKRSEIGCPDVSVSFARKNMARRLSKRRTVSGNWNSKKWELEEDRCQAQPVVLLDDEDAHPTPSAQGDNTSNDCEYRICYPSSDDPECVELKYSDLKCLDPELYLSSPIMNYYIQKLQSSSSMAKRKGDCYMFNTYFYSKLEEAMSSKVDRTASFLKLRRWLKGVHIFEKAYILLPIHGDMHWSLVIICVPAKDDDTGLIILHLDSLGLHESSHIFFIVGRYLQEEWNFINQNAFTERPISKRLRKQIPCKIEKQKIMVPQQKNEYDCGLFVLYFMERFIEDAPERLRKKDFAMFGREWFRPEEASGLRSKVREMVIKEFESNMLRFQDSHATSSASENAEEPS